MKSKLKAENEYNLARNEGICPLEQQQLEGMAGFVSKLGHQVADDGDVWITGEQRDQY